jgi:hypothetical protein
VPTQDVIVYYNLLSPWITLHWVGGLPIMPYHIWYWVPWWDYDADGSIDTWLYDPEIENTLMGSGPYIFDHRVPGIEILLTAFTTDSYWAKYPAGDGSGEDPNAAPWHNGIVFWQDMLVVLVNYGKKYADPEWTTNHLVRTDFNGDRQIFWQDLLSVLVNYGRDYGLGPGYFS